MTSVSLVTPTYWRDLERCALLCESVDRHVTSFAKHYLIVADDELPLFARFAGGRRVVLPSSELLPAWLRPIPRFIRHKGRRYWWSMHARPVSGWHVQQLLKIAASSALSEQRYCLLDSDVVFYQPFDLGDVLRDERTPLLNMPGAITAGAPLHAPWVRAARHLLGLSEPAFPADDFIGHVIFWDQRTVHAMIARIEHVTGLGWVQALCRVREFSEYILYGSFVRSDAGELARHAATSQKPCMSYWEPGPLNREGLEKLLRLAGRDHVAFSAASFSGTPIALIRSVLDEGLLTQRQVA